MARGGGETPRGGHELVVTGIDWARGAVLPPRIWRRERSSFTKDREENGAVRGEEEGKEKGQGEKRGGGNEK